MELHMTASAAKYKVSLGTRPQANDDNFNTADKLMTAVIGEGETFDVMANDLGGNAKSLAWVGYADTELQSQLGSDVAIASDMVSYALTDAAIAKVQESVKGTIVEDTFTYKIQLGDGTYSTATATVYIEAVNHAAEFAGTTTGAVKEDKTLTATGTLTVTDRDGGNDVGFDVARTNGQAGTYGSFKLDESGTWTYTLNNAAANVQALTAAAAKTDTFNVFSVDGTSQQVTLNVAGTDESDFQVMHSDGFLAGGLTANPSWSLLGNGRISAVSRNSPDYNAVITAREYIEDDATDFGVGLTSIISDLRITDDSLTAFAENSHSLASALITKMNFAGAQQLQFQYKFIDGDYNVDGDALFNVYINGTSVVSLNDSATSLSWATCTIDISELVSMDNMKVSFVGIALDPSTDATIYIDNVKILG
jgi:VCBS repeat-containing protein